METYATITGRTRKGVYEAQTRDGRTLFLAGSQDRTDLRKGYGVLCEGIWNTETSFIAPKYRVVDVTCGKPLVARQ